MRVGAPVLPIPARRYLRRPEKGRYPMISFPFQVDPETGEIETVMSGSDEEIRQAVALHVLTYSGERPLRPGFGTESLPFSDGIDEGALQLQLTDYGWGHVSITSIDTEMPENGKVKSTINWERNS